MDEEVIHHFTSDQKLQWWGYGEWVEEPDEVNFDHMGLHCKVIRVSAEEPYAKKFHMFGGYLCGYVKIPEFHPFYGKKDIFNFDIDVHGGITCCSDSLFEGYWIGFDCAHSNDSVPSMEKLRKTLPELKEMDQRRKNLFEQFKLDSIDSIWNQTYKNIEFVKAQCKSMAKQVKQAETAAPLVEETPKD